MKEEKKVKEGGKDIQELPINTERQHLKTDEHLIRHLEGVRTKPYHKPVFQL